MGQQRRMRRGQSTIEYLLVTTAALLAVVYGVKTYIAKTTATNMDTAGDIMDKASTELHDTVLGTTK